MSYLGSLQVSNGEKRTPVWGSPSSITTEDWSFEVAEPNHPPQEVPNIANNPKVTMFVTTRKSMIGFLVLLIMRILRAEAGIHEHVKIEMATASPVQVNKPAVQQE